MSRARPLLALACASLLGCQAILGLDEGKDRQTTSTTSSSSSTTTSSTSSTSSTTGGAGGAGGTGTTTTTGAGGMGGATTSTTGAGGGTTTTTTGSGGAGGTSSTSTTGAGGMGGATTSTTGAGGAAPSCADGLKNGGETDIDCGGGCPQACALGKACGAGVDCQSGDCFAGACGAVLLLAGGNAASVLGGELRPNGTWTTSVLGGATTFGPALAITSGSKGVGLIRENGTAALRAVTWSAGQWSAFSDVGPLVTTREQPSISAAGAGARAAFHGDNFKHYHASWNGLVWSPEAEAVGEGADQSAGPSPPQIAASPAFPAGAEATVVFIANAVNKPFARNRVAGAWAASQMVDGSATNFNLAPDVVAMTAGPELMMVWMRSDDQVLYSTRSNGVWSAGAVVPSAFTASRASLAALPGGGAILAFQGTDNFLYYALYAAGAWGAVLPFSAPNVPLAGSPSVTHGIGGATAEIAFAKSTDNIVYHARYIGGSWTVPVVVGGSNMSRVALASAP